MGNIDVQCLSSLLAEEDWDDELPVWAVGQQKPFDSLLRFRNCFRWQNFCHRPGNRLHLTRQRWELK